LAGKPSIGTETLFRQTRPPHLIGAALHPDIIRLTEYFEEENVGWYEAIGRVFYRLFSFDVMAGVNLGTYNVAERKYHREGLTQRHLHITGLQRELEQAEFKLYDLNYKLNEKDDEGTNEPEPLLRLVSTKGGVS
jgi:hypothetical protein